MEEKETGKGILAILQNRKRKRNKEILEGMKQTSLGVSNSIATRLQP